MIQKVTTPVTQQWLEALIDGTMIEHVIPGERGDLHLLNMEVDRADKLTAILSHLADAIHDAGFVIRTSCFQADYRTVNLGDLTAEEMRCVRCDCKASVRTVSVLDNGDCVCDACDD